MNQDIIQGKWKQIKGEIRRVWGDITNDELEESKGNLTTISGLIQEKYGQKKAEVSSKLNYIFNQYGDRAKELKKDATQATENIKKDLKKHI